MNTSGLIVVISKQPSDWEKIKVVHRDIDPQFNAPWSSWKLQPARVETGSLSADIVFASGSDEDFRRLLEQANGGGREILVAAHPADLRNFANVSRSWVITLFHHDDTEQIWVHLRAIVSHICDKNDVDPMIETRLGELVSLLARRRERFAQAAIALLHGLWFGLITGKSPDGFDPHLFLAKLKKLGSLSSGEFADLAGKYGRVARHRADAHDDLTKLRDLLLGEDGKPATGLISKMN